ncbi:MAG: hypothetical protein K0U86_03955 [Planctomycetes bacterium]|nr:hypothetical protein [Planctomycetota bacterium]MCH9778095.1 hypothetical protein [Planctomycetota bacterium]
MPIDYLTCSVILLITSVLQTELLSAEEMQINNSIYNAGNRVQLFVDQDLVSSFKNVSFNLHEGVKHPDNPLLKAEEPFEGWKLQIYGTVLFDKEEDIFKMWYFSDATDEFPHFSTHYATSTDGIHWKKPLVGTVKAKSGAKHNAVLNGYLLASVMKDNQESNPAKRYKMICWRQKPAHGAHLMVSPDGLNWTQVNEKPFCRSSDVITGHYDPYRKEYIAFPKLVTNNRGHIRRCFGLSTSKNFSDWTPSRPIFKADARDDYGAMGRIESARHLLDVEDDQKLVRTEFYGISAYPHESCTIAFPWIFTINNNARYGNHEGPMEVQFASSRDLTRWDRSFRKPIIPRGKKGEWDEGIQIGASTAFEYGDEIRLYYSGANYTHGTPCLYREKNTGRKTKYTCNIGLVSWKKDRFVSVDANENGGVLTTVPIKFSGKHLYLNAKTFKQGSIYVDVLDASGNRIPDVPRMSFTGDDIRGKVQFTSGNSEGFSSLQDKLISLKFHLKNCELYSYGFHD